MPNVVQNILYFEDTLRIWLEHKMYLEYSDSSPNLVSNDGSQKNELTSESINHQIQSGESIIAIPELYGVSVEDIKRWHNLSSSKIVAGKSLIIYSNGKGNNHKISKTTVIKDNGSSTTHKVKKGETLGAIAEKYKVSISSIQQLNKISGNKIIVGQELKIPGGTTTTSQMSKNGYHTVENGETLSSIAIKYNTSVQRGGLRGLTRALAKPSVEIVETIVRSGLRGRGGAGFPTGVKWRTALQAEGARKFIVCNADEGDSGTFADRMLMEGDPFCLIEGMAIAAIAVGATRGYVYIRSEYPHAVGAMRAAIERASRAGVLGATVMDSPHAFELEVRVGAGAYVCGDETALLESIEGRRGQVRARPPLPAHRGLFGCPTVVNNVLSLAAVPFILAEGAAAYAELGCGRSRGTMPIQLAGNVRRGGLFETPFGIPLGELVDDVAGGTASGRPVRAVQVGGPLGAYFPRSLFATSFDYEAFAARDGLIGHGGS